MEKKEVVPFSEKSAAATFTNSHPLDPSPVNHRLHFEYSSWERNLSEPSSVTVPRPPPSLNLRSGPPLFRCMCVSRLEVSHFCWPGSAWVPAEPPRPRLTDSPRYPLHLCRVRFELTRRRLRSLKTRGFSQKMCFSCSAM